MGKQCWLEVLSSIIILDEKAMTDEDIDRVPNLSVLSVYCVSIYIHKSPTKVLNPPHYSFMKNVPFNYLEYSKSF